jgi:Flp pilus assembly pilin Flp
MKILPLLKKLRRDERGISAVEYAILLGVVGVALVFALGGVGNTIGKYVNDQITNLNTATTAAKPTDK